MQLIKKFSDKFKKRKKLYFTFLFSLGLFFYSSALILLTAILLRNGIITQTKPIKASLK